MMKRFVVFMLIAMLFVGVFSTIVYAEVKLEKWNFGNFATDTSPWIRMTVLWISAANAENFNDWKIIYDSVPSDFMMAHERMQERTIVNQIIDAKYRNFGFIGMYKTAKTPEQWDIVSKLNFHRSNQIDPDIITEKMLSQN